MFTAVTFAAVVGFFCGAALAGTLSKMNMTNEAELENKIEALERENLMFRTKLVDIEKARQERLHRRLHHAKIQARAAKNTSRPRVKNPTT